MTPNLVVIEIRAPHWHMPRLWLPLFLLWVPAILLSPLIALVLVAAGIAFGVKLWRVVGVLWRMLCALPGTDVRVVADGRHVSVKII